MIKEKYTIDDTNTHYAFITKNDDNYFNPYEVEMKICFADYESARAFIESAGFSSAFKKIIRD